MIVDDIYERAPVCLQNLMCSVKGWEIKKRRYNTSFFLELENYERGVYKPEQELYNFLLAIRYVPNYQYLIDDSLLIQSNDNKRGVYKFMQSLPIIDKNYVKEHFYDFVNTQYAGKQFLMHTSGTTGGGLVFPYSVEMENKQWAVWWRYRRSHGIDLDTWCGWFGGRAIIPPLNKHYPFWRINYPGKQIMFSSYHLNESTVKYYHSEILKRKLTWLHGYPSSLTRIAFLIIDNGLSPIDNISIITTGGENLLDYQINMMRQAFPNALVRNHYGLSEGVANFSQNVNGDWIVDDDFCYVEFIPVSDNNPNVCRIIGTGFSNLAFPLVRYDTGDIAIVEWKNGIPIVKSIDGRKDDYISLPNGVKLGRLDFILKKQTCIKEAQIHQKQIDLIEIKVVKGNRYSLNDEKALLDEAYSRFGKNMKIDIVYVDKIERTKSGKLRFVISDIK